MAWSGERNPMYGRKRTHSPETIGKLQEAGIRRGMPRRMGMTEYFSNIGIKLGIDTSQKAGRKRTAIHQRTPERALLEMEKEQVIAEAIRQLAPAQRRIVESLFFSGKDILSAAKQLGIKPEKARLLLETALIRLAENKQVQEVA